MSDPFSLSTGIVGLVGLALQLVVGALGMIDKSVSAHDEAADELRHLQEDLEDLQEQMIRIHTTLKVLASNTKDYALKKLLREEASQAAVTELCMALVQTSVALERLTDQTKAEGSKLSLMALPNDSRSLAFVQAIIKYNLAPSKITILLKCLRDMRSEIQKCLRKLDTTFQHVWTLYIAMTNGLARVATNLSTSTTLTARVKLVSWLKNFEDTWRLSLRRKTATKASQALKEYLHEADFSTEAPTQKALSNPIFGPPSDYPKDPSSPTPQPAATHPPKVRPSNRLDIPVPTVEAKAPSQSTSAAHTNPIGELSTPGEPSIGVWEPPPRSDAWSVTPIIDYDDDERRIVRENVESKLRGSVDMAICTQLEIVLDHWNPDQKLPMEYLELLCPYSTNTYPPTFRCGLFFCHRPIEDMDHARSHIKDHINTLYFRARDAYRNRSQSPNEENSSVSTKPNVHGHQEPSSSRLSERNFLTPKLPIVTPHITTVEWSGSKTVHERHQQHDGSSQAPLFPTPVPVILHRDQRDRLEDEPMRDGLSTDLPQLASSLPVPKASGSVDTPNSAEFPSIIKLPPTPESYKTKLSEQLVPGRPRVADLLPVLPSSSHRSTVVSSAGQNPDGGKRSLGVNEVLLSLSSVGERAPPVRAAHGQRTEESVGLERAAVKLTAGQRSSTSGLYMEPKGTDTPSSATETSDLRARQAPLAPSKLPLSLPGPPVQTSEGEKEMLAPGFAYTATEPRRVQERVKESSAKGEKEVILNANIINFGAPHAIAGPRVGVIGLPMPTVQDEPSDGKALDQRPVGNEGADVIPVAAQRSGSLGKNTPRQKNSGNPTPDAANHPRASAPQPLNQAALPTIPQTPAPRQKKSKKSPALGHKRKQRNSGKVWIRPDQTERGMQTPEMDQDEMLEELFGKWLKESDDEE